MDTLSEKEHRMGVGLGLCLMEGELGYKSLSDDACFGTPQQHLGARGREHLPRAPPLLLPSALPWSAPPLRLRCHDGDAQYSVPPNAPVATGQSGGHLECGGKAKKLTFKLYLTLIP